MYLRSLLLVIVVGLGCGLVAAGLFAWSSSASKTIALSTGTLLAAAFLFALQMAFELRSSQAKDLMSVEYTFDRAKPEVRQPSFTVRESVPRLHYEVAASAWLVKNEPVAFENNAAREKLVLDLAAAETLYFFAQQEFDWQATRLRFAGSTGQIFTAQRVSQKGECSDLTPTDFARVLRDDGNQLAEMPITVIGGSVCLPPQSSVVLKGRVLTIANPFGTLRFEPVLSGAVSYMRPGRSGASIEDATPQLPDGTPQWETRIVGVWVTSSTSWLYSQHRDAAKYATWRKRVVDGLGNWFEHVAEQPGAHPLPPLQP